MADEQTPQEGEQQEGAKPEAPQYEPKQEAEQLGEAGEKALAAFKERARKAEREQKKLSERVQELEDRDKTEAEKLAGKVESLAGERQTLQLENVRLRVALQKGLPPELIDRLKGATPEELEKDADELMKLVKGPEATDFSGGARQPADPPRSPEESLNTAVLGLLGREPTRSP